MPNTLTVDDLKKMLKRKHKGRAKGIMARIEEAEGRAKALQDRVNKTENYRILLAGGLTEILNIAHDSLMFAPTNPADPEPPTEHPDEYLPPGLDAPVLRFPITDRPKFIAVVIDDHMNVSWRPDLDWPSILEQLNAEPDWYWGNSGLILHTQYGWRAVSTEWMRKGREEGGTSYPFAEQIAKVGEGAKLTPGTPVGVFVASLWRAGWSSKVARRTHVQWFDPETWERIEVPDFTVPEQVEVDA